MTQALLLDGLSLIGRQASISTGAAEIDASQEALTARAQLELVLDVSLARLRAQGETDKIIAELTLNLHRLRRGCDPDIWNNLIARCLSHGICDFLFQDPLTRWSFEKPRGYSGDAHLLDLIYGHSAIEGDVERSSALGRAIYAQTHRASSSVAVRERLQLLAQTVDTVASRREKPVEILSIASGHLREAMISKALDDGRIKRWVALDQDPVSVGTVASAYASPVEAINGSVRSLLANRHALGTFDLVYAAGLFDYLATPVAVKVARKSLQMLRPGGLFLFANFSDETKVDGYMEAFMNWPLLLRTEADMRAIATQAIDTAGIKPSAPVVHTFFGANRDVIYCEIAAGG